MIQILDSFDITFSSHNIHVHKSPMQHNIRQLSQYNSTFLKDINKTHVIL